MLVYKMDRSLSSSTQPKPTNTYVAEHGRNPDVDGWKEGDLEFKTGDVIVVTRGQKEGKSWWKGYMASDPTQHVGLFPHNYVRQETPGERQTREDLEDADETVAEQDAYVAKHDLTPDDDGWKEGDLEFETGDVIIVTRGGRKSGRDWWRGYMASDPTQHVGLFPSNYVRKETPEERQTRDDATVAYQGAYDEAYLGLQRRVDHHKDSDGRGVPMDEPPPHPPPSDERSSREAQGNVKQGTHQRRK